MTYNVSSGMVMTLTPLLTHTHRIFCKRIIQHPPDRRLFTINSKPRPESLDTPPWPAGGRAFAVRVSAQPPAAASADCRQTNSRTEHTPRLIGAPGRHIKRLPRKSLQRNSFQLFSSVRRRRMVYFGSARPILESCGRNMAQAYF